MSLYCGIDLHSNNNFVCVIDEHDNRLLEVKLNNHAEHVVKALSRYKERLKGVAVESTYNWYWLVDALTEAGFKAQLVNTAKVVQYSGLKRTNDRYDAFHLAHLMRLGILPTGYIYPKQQRSLRDLLRKRMQLVQDRSREIIRLKSFIQLHTGTTIRADIVKAKKFVPPVIGDMHTQLSLHCAVEVIRDFTRQIKAIEQVILQRVESSEDFQHLKSVPGIGDVLAQTILLEIGAIQRFHGPGNFASYCRCVDSRRESNGKKKGKTTVRMAIAIWPGRLSKPPTLRFATATKPKAFISAKRNKPIRLWRGRPWPTNWPGRVIGCCAMASTTTKIACSVELGKAG